MRQSTVVGAEPDSAIAGSPGTYNDITHQPTVVLREMAHHLTRLGIIDQNTLVVGAQPVITCLILAGCGHIAQIDTFQTGKTSDILVHTIFI